MTTERFDLNESEVLTDTVFLEGSLAEESVKDVIGASVRRTFGSSLPSTFWRDAGPDDIEPVRERYLTLGDFVRNGGKMLGVQHIGAPAGCFRFNAQRRCAQILVDGVPVNLTPALIHMSDVEAVVAIHPAELGRAITTSRFGDDSRYGTVLVFTTGYIAR